MVERAPRTSQSIGYEQAFLRRYGKSFNQFDIIYNFSENHVRIILPELKTDITTDREPWDKLLLSNFKKVKKFQFTSSHGSMKNCDRGFVVNTGNFDPSYAITLISSFPEYDPRYRSSQRTYYVSSSFTKNKLLASVLPIRLAFCETSYRSMEKREGLDIYQDLKWGPPWSRHTGFGYLYNPTHVYKRKDIDFTRGGMRISRTWYGRDMLWKDTQYEYVVREYLNG